VKEKRDDTVVKQFSMYSDPHPSFPW